MGVLNTCGKSMRNGARQCSARDIDPACMQYNVESSTYLVPRMRAHMYICTYMYMHAAPPDLAHHRALELVTAAANIIMRYAGMARAARAWRVVRSRCRSTCLTGLC